MNLVSIQIVLTIFGFLRVVLGDCVSYGWDFVDGGKDYFINSLDTGPFSFGTIFYGCTPDDTAGQPVYPVVVDPDENEYFCSDIADQPDGAVQISTCNLPDGPQLYKNNMKSGTYYIVVQGTTFAWMRTFTIVAGPQTTVTATPTATFNITVTPSTTISTTITSQSDTTFPPLTSTITLPSTTSTRTLTIRPSRVTVSTTSTLTKTKASSMVFSHVLVTTTKTLTCMTQTPKKDPACTLNISKLFLSAASAIATDVPGFHRGRKMPMQRPRIPDRIIARRNIQREIERRELFAKRTADLPTTVVVETTYIATMYSTFTAPTSTITDTYYTTTTSTITPPLVTSTSYSGRAKTTVTTTLSTPTKTSTIRTTATSYTTRTIWATVTVTSKIAPNSLICIAGATPIMTS